MTFSFFFLSLEVTCQLRQLVCSECEINYSLTCSISLQALAKFQTTQKVTTKSGIDQENELLNESAAKETSLNLQIMDLENETKQVSSDGY